MKIAISILLSALPLTFSSISTAAESMNSQQITIEEIVEHCARGYGFHKLGSGWINNNNEYKTIDYRKETDELNYRADDDQMVKFCVNRQLPGTVYGYGWNNLSLEELNSKKKELEELKVVYDSVEFSEKTIIDKKNKIKFELTNVVPPTRAEICADKKGKFDYGFDEYAFCMGTKVHQAPTCQNQYGDPCGTKYDKSRAGYTIKDN
ncbi:hypothetical protein [Acinetobacter pittii]|uniref:hypothetical protein n=1 Tax=Acinetobacter pittii TaxID=48296 RepID=UPI002AFDD6A6|nr:hypothetical protein [Acinetobacter pittii]